MLHETNVHWRKVFSLSCMILLVPDSVQLCCTWVWFCPFFIWNVNLRSKLVLWQVLWGWHSRHDNLLISFELLYCVLTRIWQCRNLQILCQRINGKILSDLWMPWVKCCFNKIFVNNHQWSQFDVWCKFWYKFCWISCLGYMDEVNILNLAIFFSKCMIWLYLSC